MYCPNCHSEKNSQIKPYAGLHPTFQRMTLQQCSDCDLVFADPQPTEEELQRYYATYWDGSVATSTPSTRRYYLAQSLSRVRYMSTFLAEGRAVDVLDVGAGLGLFGDSLRSCGVSGSYVAVEPDNEQYNNLYKKFGAENVFKDMSDVPHGRTFDLIVLAHVLEHMKDPHGFINSFMPFLRSGGLLLVEVPHGDYRYKDNFESHLLFFSSNSLKATLAAHGEVLDVCSVGKEAKYLHIKNNKPQHGLIAIAKETVKSILAVLTPNVLDKQIERFEMSSYGGDRQWLRAVMKKP